VAARLTLAENVFQKPLKPQQHARAVRGWSESCLATVYKLSGAGPQPEGPSPTSVSGRERQAGTGSVGGK
jgi:hypothetical protein